MTAPLTMREIMSETGHTLISPDVLTRAEDMALRMVATGRSKDRIKIECEESEDNVSVRCFASRVTGGGAAIYLEGGCIGLDAAEEVAITLLALVAVARRDGNG